MRSQVGGSARGTPQSSAGKIWFHDKGREVWGSRASSVDSNLSLPRPRGPVPSPPARNV